MVRYLIVIPSLLAAAGLAVVNDGIGAASKEGESIGGLHRADQPREGSGEFDEAQVDHDAPDRERMIGTAVLTEKDVMVDTDAFAEIVLETLNDERGWGGDGSVGFEPVVVDAADLTVRLATPGTVDELCAPLNTNGYTSCRIGDELVLNVDRWAAATEEFLDAGGTLDDYRAYLLNHEAGHYLGHGHEDSCEDGLAPVMMQQTLDLRGCEPNGWLNIP